VPPDDLFVVPAVLGRRSLHGAGDRVGHTGRPAAGVHRQPAVDQCGYALASVAFQLPAGKLGDRVGHRTMLLSGSLFGASSLVAAQADSPASRIALRVVMSFGGVLIMPMALGCAARAVPGFGRARPDSVVNRYT
jgi:MFS family permease